jgi:hypothetical protein
MALSILGTTTRGSLKRPPSEVIEQESYARRYPPRNTPSHRRRSYLADHSWRETKRKANGWRPVVLIGPDRARNQRQTLWISGAEKAQGTSRTHNVCRGSVSDAGSPNVVLSEIELLSLMSIEGCRLRGLLEKERIVIQEILKAAERERATSSQKPPD